MLTANLATDCAVDERLTSLDAAFQYLSTLAGIVAETEAIPVEGAVGRVLAQDITTAIPLPPFDNSAVDGFGVSASDLNSEATLRLKIVGRLAAGGPTGLPLQAGEAVKLFTGAAVPPGVRGIVLEERCHHVGSNVSIGVPIPDGANIRQRGEDVPEGSSIIEAPAILDARHAAILVAAGIRQVVVRRKVRVAVFSNGNELRDPGHALDPGSIFDANRPMLLALLSCGWIEAIDAGRHPDDPSVLTEVFASVARDADVIIGTGGASGSGVDHVAPAVIAAGGSIRRLRLALRPGKPVLGGSIGRTTVLGLPGNPVAALVNFMLFGRALVALAAGLPALRPRGQVASAVGEFRHSVGRIEFVPARIVGSDATGRPRIEKLGRGGSARLRPLVMADGLAEIPADCADLAEGSDVAFHPFKAAFAP